MNWFDIIIVSLICIFGSVFIYGLWLLENDRYEFKKKHGFDPWRHGWDVDKEDENDDKNKDQ